MLTYDISNENLERNEFENKSKVDVRENFRRNCTPIEHL